MIDDTFYQRLVGIEEAARYSLISIEKLKHLTEQNLCPFYRLDGGEPLYKKTELRHWIQTHLILKNEPIELPPLIKIFSPIPFESNPPSSINNIPGLQQLRINGLRSGVYFLCESNEVVYVGQAANILIRISKHLSENKKKFNPTSIYFIPLPTDLLKKTEDEFIAKLNPKYNKKIKFIRRFR